MDVSSSQLLLAFSLTLLAGLSTGIGSAISFFAKKENTTFLAVSLGFSAGVMIYVSFVEILNDSFNTLKLQFGDKLGSLYAVLAFFGGILFTLLIDMLVPEKENPHEVRSFESENKEDIIEAKELHKNDPNNSKMMRVGYITAIVIAIHNFPEGMVTFLAGLKEISVALPIAFAIALHNIPEGISVSVPIFYATGSKRKAFWLSFLSGLAEPVGAVVGYLILLPFLSDTLFGIIFGVIAGIMVYISLDELLPAAEEYGKHHQAIFGLIAGMAIMAFSLLIF